MGFYKKTVLLSNQSNYDNGMAILTIEQNNGGVFGSLKVFDLPKSTNLILGISVDGKQTIKQKVAFLNGNVYNFKLNNDFQINGKIGSVLVDISNHDVKALIWGTNGAMAQYKNDIINIIEKDIEPQVHKSCVDTDSKLALQEAKTVISELKQEKTEFKAELFESSDEEINDIVDEEMSKKGEFFELIGEQVDELFKRFPENDDLARIIPHSKWIKIDYENNGREYVLGLIYNNSNVEYICYGVPGRVDVLPPEELQEYSQWLPVGENNSQGYWIMFQNAETGDSVVIDRIKFS